MRHLRHVTRFALGLSMLSAGVLTASTAHANGFETLANGTEQMGRGAAWLARASDPLATFYNPAALSRNGNGVSVTVNLFFGKNCFQRLGPNGQPVEIGGGGGTYPEACNEVTPFPNPQLAFQYRISEKLGIGVAVMGPSANGKLSYPTNTDTTVQVNSGGLGSPQVAAVKPLPSGSRYLLTELDAKIIWPQVGIGYEVAPKFRIGATFIWGIAILKFGNVSLGQNTGQVASTMNPGRVQELGTSDLNASVTGKDLFVPGFVVSALYEATEQIDLAVWYHWSKAVNASGQGDITGWAYDSTDPSKPDTSATVNHTPDNQAKITVPQPMEARIGARFHMPRAAAPVSAPSDGSVAPPPASAAPYRVTDPIHDDLFDVELDAEWSHDSQFDNFGLTFPAGVGIKVDGAPLANVPVNADVAHKWKDSYGLRFGGDYVAIQDRLALRAGTWFQTSSIDPKYLHIDFVPAQRLALTLGATVRLGPVDVQVGFAHVFAKTIDNGGNGGITALSGQADATHKVSDASPGLCPPGTPNRSECAINGGRLSSVTNIASLGVVYRWQ